MEQVVHLFSWLDYTVFTAILALSVLIGVYFGFIDKKQNSPNEYLHGGKKMGVIPVAASLIASDISGFMLLAVPADIYTNGLGFLTTAASTIFTTITVIYIFLPVFYNLEMSTGFEYLNVRFSNRVCKMTSFIFAFLAIIYLPITIYIPAIAFSQVSGFQMNFVIPLVCIICVFYTTLGGIKAVIWTDFLQLIMMIGSVATVLILGVYIEGGIANVWDNAVEGGRTKLNFDLDYTNSTSVITIVSGFTVLSCGYGINPIFTQRFLSVPTLKDAKLSAILFTIGACCFKLACCFLGLIIYSHYADCSPLLAGAIKKSDQILPYYITDVASKLPGLPGIFIAGIFSAALSTISAALNTMSGVIYNDFIKQHLSKNTTDKTASNIMKLIVIIIGSIFIALVFLVQQFGTTVLQLGITITGIIIGPLLAMFALGILVPIINEKGIFYGSIAGLLFTCWVMFGAIHYHMTGRLTQQTYLPLEIDNNCNITRINANIISNLTSSRNHLPPPMYLYRISFYCYSLLGFLATVIVAFPVSILTGGLRQKVDRRLLSSVIYPFLSKKSNDNFGQEKELQEF